MVPDRFAPVLRELAPLTERFRAAGHRLYLVGGTVRDLLVDSGRADFDLDLTTDARPDQIKACLHGWADATWSQGEKFGTIGAHKINPETGNNGPTRSPRFEPRPTPTTLASRTSCSPMRSRSTSLAAISRSTQWLSN